MMQAELFEPEPRAQRPLSRAVRDTPMLVFWGHIGWAI
jgi:hypothetical protein